MAGIYIHIPFCKQACHYCNFHFSTSTRLKNGFLQALLKEIEFQKSFLGGEIVETIYLGGGTPSMLSGGELNSIMTQLTRNFRIAAEVEITLEANPDDLNSEKLMEWKSNMINRLSLGVQSFYDADLKWMNRAHDASQAIESIAMAQVAGFHNMSIDLIFGTPTLSDDDWISNLGHAISLNIPHLSCYSLTVEPKTALEKLIRNQKLPGINSEAQARQFLLAAERLTSAGYEQYEISNYSLPGKRSRHNSSYWQGKQYLGLGPSAHSFNGFSRQWNVANNALYIQLLQKGIIPFEVEVLTSVQRMNEYIMTSLRTSEGLNLEDGTQSIPANLVNILRAKCRKYINERLMIERNNAFILSGEGKLLADGIAAALFFEEKEIRDYDYAAASSGT